LIRARLRTNSNFLRTRCSFPKASTMESFSTAAAITRVCRVYSVTAAIAAPRFPNVRERPSICHALVVTRSSSRITRVLSARFVTPTQSRSAETFSAFEELPHEVRSRETCEHGHGELRDVPSRVARRCCHVDPRGLQRAHNLLTLSHTARAIRWPRYLLMRNLSPTGWLLAHAG